MNSLGFVDLIKSFICALSDFNISLGVPDHEIVCLSIKITLSATLHTDASILPKRKIASSSLKNFGLAILARNAREISEIINKISPEHLEIYTKNQC